RNQSKRTDFESERSFSFRTRLGRTACTTTRIAERTEELSDQFDPIVMFDRLDFSKAMTQALSENLGHVWSKVVHGKNSASTFHDLPIVHLLTAGHATRFV